MTKGELLAIEFVPKDFRFIEAVLSRRHSLSDRLQLKDSPKLGRCPADTTKTEDLEAKRRAAMMKSIADAIKKPAAGQKRAIGFLDRVECTSKAAFFHIRTGNGTSPFDDR